MLCKQWGRECDAVLNLTLTCYYFETFVIVTWCKLPEAMLCKQGGRECNAVLNLTLSCFFHQTTVHSVN